MKIPTDADIQRLIDRFVKARWIKLGMRTSEPPFDFHIIWTEEGRQGMSSVRRLLVKHRPHLFDSSTPRGGFFSGIWLELRVRRLTRKLRPPGFSTMDYRMILSFAATAPVDVDGRILLEYHGDLKD